MSSVPNTGRSPFNSSDRRLDEDDSFPDIIVFYTRRSAPGHEHCCGMEVVIIVLYSDTCHKRPSPIRRESGSSSQVAAGYRDINTAKSVVCTLQKWPAEAGGRSRKGPAVAGIGW